MLVNFLHAVRKSLTSILRIVYFSSQFQGTLQSSMVEQSQGQEKLEEAGHNAFTVRKQETR